MRIHLTDSQAAIVEGLVRTELLAVMSSETTPADKLRQTAELHDIHQKLITTKPEPKRKPKAA
jgi:hypothetical protein